ncbi:MAG: deoxyribose-phosphate aldolase, partial [bacterium]|nr:deoxyribose-phosphate aldolase [bacterium]
MNAFNSETFLPPALWEKLIEVRRDDPRRPLRSAKKRKRRQYLSADGRLNILAADHPA